MNILIQQTKAFPHRANSFYWFYAQLTEWLTAHGVNSKLYFSYLELADSEFENGLLLPDHYSQFYTPRNIEAICRFIIDKQIDVILDYSHVITGDTRKYYLEIKKRNPGIKICTMIHNCPSHTTQLKQYELSTLRFKDVHGPKKLFQWMLPQLYISLLKKVVSHQNRSAYDTLDEVVLLSPAYIPEFKKLIGKKDAWKLSAIPNAIKPVHSNIPIEEKDKEIIFVGRMATEKALPKLLKIWGMVQDKLPDWKLTLVGDGPARMECLQIIETYQLKRVQWIGYQMSIPHIDRARILCLTSVIEGLPTVFIEAMDLGVIPIGFNSFQSIYDIIDHGKNGFIIPNNDYQAYADTLLQLAQNDEWRQRIAKNAQSRPTKCSIDQIGARWMEVFKKHHLIPQNHNMEDIKIHIALAANSNYIIPVTVALQSIFDHHTENLFIYLLFLKGALKQSDLETISEFVKNHGAIFTPLEVGYEQIAGFPASRHGKSTLLRLCLPTLLPNLDKILYLDGDIVVMDNLTALFQTNLSSYYIAAAKDSTRIYHPNYQTALGIESTHWYFNAGVTLLNLDQLRKINLPNVTNQFVHQYYKRIIAPDQDVLNYICQGGKTLYIHPKYNMNYAVEKDVATLVWGKQAIKEAKKNPAIIHFIGPVKPWSVLSVHPARKYWWRYLKKTTFSGYKPVDANFRKRLLKLYLSITKTIERQFSLETKKKIGKLIPSQLKKRIKKSMLKSS